jgi:hypothetical protein
MMVVVVVVRFLEMHMYITSALQKTDMKAVGLQLALELLHEKVIKRQSHKQETDCFMKLYTVKVLITDCFLFLCQR